jgi:hypothetical protein
MIRWWILIIALIACNAYAQPCEIEMEDLSQTIQSAGQTNVLKQSSLTDPLSNEPIRRYVQLQPDGAIIITDQKHCLMYNLSINVINLVAYMTA